MLKHRHKVTRKNCNCHNLFFVAVDVYKNWIEWLLLPLRRFDMQVFGPLRAWVVPLFMYALNTEQKNEWMTIFALLRAWVLLLFMYALNTPQMITFAPIWHASIWPSSRVSVASRPYHSRIRSAVSLCSLRSVWISKYGGINCLSVYKCLFVKCACANF